MRRRFELALRYRIMLAFWIFMLGGMVFSGVVYQRHMTIQHKLWLVEKAEELRNQVLEARRYEKNFLLYGGKDNFLSMTDHISRADEHLDNLDVSWTTMARENFISLSRNLLNEYGQAAHDYWRARSEPDGPEPAGMSAMETEAELRNTGRILTNTIDETVKVERERVYDLISRQRESLVYSLLAFALLSFLVAYYFFYQIVKPLSAINRAVEDITQGRVREIPRVSGSLEIQSLIQVLNSMIRQLERKFEQLIQREKLASLGTLTSGVAHELNNPLSNISTSTQILLEELNDSDPEFQRRYLEGMEEQVEKARDIVRSLLEFAREREFEPQETEISSLVEKTVRLMRSEIPSGVDVEIRARAPVMAEVDGRHMSQAIMNVAMNSVQAMGREGRLRLSVEQKDDMVVVEVADNGPGIPEELLSKIFDPFFTTKEVGQGTGLGLYLVYGIIQKHGGRINVLSEPGQGTRVVMEIPGTREKADHGE
ncbi:MAG: sensor histidine kinase [Desulfatibacillaceae bacterium]